MGLDERREELKQDRLKITVNGLSDKKEWKEGRREGRERSREETVSKNKVGGNEKCGNINLKRQ